MLHFKIIAFECHKIYFILQILHRIKFPYVFKKEKHARKSYAQGIRYMKNNDSQKMSKCLN